MVPLGGRRGRPLLRVVRLDGAGGRLGLGHGNGRQRRDVGAVEATAESRGAQRVEVGPQARRRVAASVHCEGERLASLRVSNEAVI